MKYQIFFIVFVVAVVSSCSKRDEGSNSIVGIWKEVEAYDGSWTNPNRDWQPVPDAYADHLEFSENFIYKQTSTGSAACMGTWQLTATDTLIVNSNCYTRPNEFKVEVLNSNTLICGITGICGPLKYKYKRIGTSSVSN